MSTIVEMMREKANELTSKIRQSVFINHPGEVGRAREEFIRDFLRPFIPKCYGLETGKAYAADGVQSRQTDILVIDDIFSSALFRSDSFGLFPCETVYGAIEIKSNLTKDELRKGIRNIASLKALPRAATDILDISPNYRLKLGPGLKQSGKPRPHNPYLGYILGLKGIKPETLLTSIEEELNANPPIKTRFPDCIFCLDPGYVFLKAKRMGTGFTEVPCGSEFDGYYGLTTGEDTLSFFYLSLLISLGQIRLRTPDFSDLWSAQRNKAQIGGKGFLLSAGICPNIDPRALEYLKKLGEA